MSSLNTKAHNRSLLNKKIFEFFDGLVENFKFIINCNNINPIDTKKLVNFKVVNELIEKNYVKNKHRKVFKTKIEDIKNSFGNKVETLSSNELYKIENCLSNFIDAISDSFQTEFGKKLSEINKKTPEESSNFKQAVFNLLMNEIEKDFKNENLPEIYLLRINKQELKHA